MPQQSGGGFGITRFFGGALVAVYNVVKRYWWIVIPVILLMHGIIESVKQMSPKPFFEEFSNKILFANYKLYKESKTINELGEKQVPITDTSWFAQKWQLIKSFNIVIVSLVSSILILVLFYKIAMWVFTHNGEAVTANLMIGLLMFYLFAVVGSFVANSQTKDIDVKTILTMPVSGYIEFGKSIPNYTNIAYQIVPKTNISAIST